jgi:type II secretory pathway pseudopilin PulG
MKTRSAQGFAIVDLIFVCAIIGILCAIALPRVVLAKGSANSASAIASMRVINSAQLSFATTCGAGFYAPNLTALAKAPVGGSGMDAFLTVDLGSADTVSKSGYSIQVSATPFAAAPDTCNALGPGATAQAFKAGADPLDASNSRYFAVNADGVIYEDTASLFATMPESAAPATGHAIQQ